MARLREQARERLSQAAPEQSFFVSSEVELTALNLLEDYVRSDPQAVLIEGQPSKEVSLQDRYGLHLSRSVARLAGLGSGHVLGPCLSNCLEQVRWDRLEEAHPNLSTMGLIDEVSRANLAAGPRQAMEWGVTITGHWSAQQFENVRGAVLELGEKTDTKAINLVREVHLRTHLGELPAGPVLGLTRTVGPIALLREQADLPGNTRWLVFHEVGHQLDRFLAGSSRRFRSHDPDTPFGKSSRPEDYVDPAQVGSAHEDFADCHARLIMDLAEIRRDPDLWIHARGPLGRKLSWILDQAYKEEVAPPSARLERVLGEVDRGASPFADRPAFHAAVNQYLDRPEGLSQVCHGWIERHFERP